MTSFTIMIAGVAAEICCHWVQNKTFFRDYLSEASPVIRIAPTHSARIANIRAFIAKTLAEHEGRYWP